MNQIPIIRIEFERMQYTLSAMIAEHMASMDPMIREAVKNVCQPENVKRILELQAKAAIEAAIKDAVESYFRYGKGRNAIKAAVEQELDRGESH